MAESDLAKFHPEFPVFFHEQYRSIVADAYFITGNKDDALEIADEAFFRAFIRWRKISSYEKPGAWVRRVAIRLATRFKIRRHRESGELTTEPVVNIDPTEFLDLRRAVLQLSPQQRAAVVLHYYDDLPLHEVAETMKCKEATVGRYLHDARDRLRALLTLEK